MIGPMDMEHIYTRMARDMKDNGRMTNRKEMALKSWKMGPSTKVNF